LAGCRPTILEEQRLFEGRRRFATRGGWRQGGCEGVDLEAAHCRLKSLRPILEVVATEFNSLAEYSPLLPVGTVCNAASVRRRLLGSNLICMVDSTGIRGREIRYMKFQQQRIGGRREWAASLTKRSASQLREPHLTLCAGIGHYWFLTCAVGAERSRFRIPGRDWHLVR